MAGAKTIRTNWPVGAASDAPTGSQGEEIMIRKFSLGVLVLLTTSRAGADWAINMPRGVTELSAETYELHMVVFWWCVAIAVVVFGAMIWSLVKHRKSKVAQPASFSHSITAEVIWTVIPIIILLIMVIPLQD